MIEKRNIFLVGPMGAGKSTIGKYLAEQLHMEFWDTDSIIERRTGVDICWVFDVEGEEGFRQRETEVINEFSKKQGIVLATGGGAIESKENRNYLSARGIVVYLETTIEKQLSRTNKDKKRPLLQTDNPRAVLEELAKTRDVLYKEITDYSIDTDDQGAKVVATKIIDLLDN